MRLLLLFALFLTASVHAQERFELTDPLLVIDGQRVRVTGPPLMSPAFENLELEIPGMGLLLVSNVPFEGSRRAGDFDNTRLVVVVNGTSVRLRSNTSLLGVPEPVPAYARLDINPLTPTEGPVTLRLMALQAQDPAPRRVAGPEPPADPPRPRTIEPADGLSIELEALRAERDRLRIDLAHAEQERDDARLRFAALRDEVEMLRGEIAGAQTPTDRLREERDALRAEVTRLRASQTALGTPTAQTPTDRPSTDSPTRISLPGFDGSRLRNRSQIEEGLRTAAYPEWADTSAIGGDVLVLFVTDVNGAVVRTAVPRPIGGGLDELAEEIVQAMRFVPVRADGHATGLRSQVVVRFTP